MLSMPSTRRTPPFGPQRLPRIPSMFRMTPIGLPSGRGDTHESCTCPLSETRKSPSTRGCGGRIGGLFGSWLRDESIGAEYGWRELFEPDPRFGHSIDHELIVRYAVEGVDRLKRFEKTHPELPHHHVLYDVDDYGDGSTAWSCLEEETWGGDWDSHKCPPELIEEGASFTVPTAEAGHAIRATVERQTGRYDSLRMPLIRPTGQHGIYNPQPFRPFDADTYMVNYTFRFMGSGVGKSITLKGVTVRHSSQPPGFSKGPRAGLGGPRWSLHTRGFESVLSGMCRGLGNLRVRKPELLPRANPLRAPRHMTTKRI